MENKKKQKKKIITKLIKKNSKKHHESIVEIFLTMRKLKKRNYANNKIKNMSDEDRERKK